MEALRRPLLNFEFLLKFDISTNQGNIFVNVGFSTNLRGHRASILGIQLS